MIPLSFRFERAGHDKRSPGYRSAWRSFGNTLITYVKGGDYCIETHDEKIFIPAETGFLIPPGCHQNVSNPDGQGADVYFTHFHCYIHNTQDFFSLLDKPLLLSHEVGLQIKRSHEIIQSCHAAQESLQESTLICLQLTKMTQLVLKEHPFLDTFYAQPEQQRLLPMLSFIQQHLSENINREILAELCDVSVPHLHSLCTAAFGKAPMDIVRRKRLQQAQQLLHWSSMPIQKIAEKCGFPDPYYFSRAFKRSEGVSPSQYRKKIIKEY